LYGWCGGGGITRIILSSTYVITVDSGGFTSKIVQGLTTILSAAGGVNGSNAQINSINDANGGKSGTSGYLGGTGATVNNNNATSGTLGVGGGTNTYSNSGAPGSTNVPFRPYNRTDFGKGDNGRTSVNLLGGSSGSGLVLLYFSL